MITMFEYGINANIFIRCYTMLIISKFLFDWSSLAYQTELLDIMHILQVGGLLEYLRGLQVKFGRFSFVRLSVGQRLISSKLMAKFHQN